jgi:hypothetical protein
MSESNVFSARRLSPRFRAQGIWAYWHCDGRAETSAVLNIGRRGVFLETGKARPIDSIAQVNFLVHEGQIRVEGCSAARGGRPWSGTEIRRNTGGDRRNLLQLLDRLGRVRAVSSPSLSALHGPEAKQQYRLKISRSVWVLEARRTPRRFAGLVRGEKIEKIAKWKR